MKIFADDPRETVYHMRVRDGGVFGGYKDVYNTNYYGPIFPNWLGWILILAPIGGGLALSPWWWLSFIPLGLYVMMFICFGVVLPNYASIGKMSYSRCFFNNQVMFWRGEYGLDKGFADEVNHDLIKADVPGYRLAVEELLKAAKKDSTGGGSIRKQTIEAMRELTKEGKKYLEHSEEHNDNLTPLLREATTGLREVNDVMGKR